MLTLLSLMASLTAGATGGTHTYLTLDHRNIIDSTNLEIELGTVDKHPANPLLKEEKAWELRFDNMQPSVWVDPVDKKWKLWYNMFATCSPMSAPICQAGMNDDGTRPKKAGQGGPVPCNGTNQLIADMPARSGALCYAESVDGVIWEKPGLGLVNFTDNAGKEYPAAETNIVLGTGLGFPGDKHGGGFPTASGVTLDEREGEARFKMLGTQAWGEGYIATSQDGKHWGNTTSMPAGRWDSHLNVQWEPDSGKWVAYARASPTTTFGGYAGGAQTVRIQAVSESRTPEFLGEWGTLVPTGLNASEWYQPDALVSFEYQGIYLGFANVISFNTTVPAQREQGGGDNPGGTVTSELVFSTDAKRWVYLKPGQSFVPRGVPGKDFDCCGIFTAKQGFQPSQQPDADSMRVYYGGCNGPFLGSRGCALGLARVQRHGWAGLKAHTTTPGHFTAAPVHVPADPIPPYDPKVCAQPSILTIHYTHHTLYSYTLLVIHYTHHTPYSPYTILKVCAHHVSSPHTTPTTITPTSLSLLPSLTPPLPILSLSSPIPPLHPFSSLTPPLSKVCAQPLLGVNCMGGDIRGVGAVATAEACCRRCAELAGCG
jgi:hypothetical protein